MRLAYGRIFTPGEVGLFRFRSGDGESQACIDNSIHSMHYRACCDQLNRFRSLGFNKIKELIHVVHSSILHVELYIDSII
jgi:hypothetical protein